MADRGDRSTTRHELVASRILEEAAALFATQGFSDTSLQDVATALGISRTALYHYIGGKDQLLAKLVHGLSRESADSLERLQATTSLGPVEKLRQASRDMALRMAMNPARFRMLLLSEGSLPEPLASEHRDARVRVLRALGKIIDDGVATGELRPVDRNVGAFAVIGMCNWVAWWYRPDHDDRELPETIADRIADIAVAGLSASATRQASDSAADPVERALHLVRQDLDELEIAVAASGRRAQRPRRKRATADDS